MKKKKRDRVGGEMVQWCHIDGGWIKTPCVNQLDGIDGPEKRVTPWEGSVVVRTGLRGLLRIMAPSNTLTDSLNTLNI